VPGYFTFIIDGGQIAGFIHTCNCSEYGPNALTPYITWLDTVHPGASDQMFERLPVVTPRLTPEAIALVPTYLAEYEASVN
jgi:hypothetical protein